MTQQRPTTSYKVSALLYQVYRKYNCTTRAKPYTSTPGRTVLLTCFLCTAVSPALRTVPPKGPGRVSSSLPGCFPRQRASPGLYRDSCRTHPGSGGVLSAGDAPSLSRRIAFIFRTVPAKLHNVFLLFIFLMLCEYNGKHFG